MSQECDAAVRPTSERKVKSFSMETEMRENNTNYQKCALDADGKITELLY